MLSSRKVSVNRKTIELEDYFLIVDTKQKGYLEFWDLMNNWEKLEEIVQNETDTKRLKAYLDKYYRQTKITKT